MRFLLYFLFGVIKKFPRADDIVDSRVNGEIYHQGGRYYRYGREVDQKLRDRNEISQGFMQNGLYDCRADGNYL